MNETEFSNMIRVFLDRELEGYEIKSKKPILYKLIINQKGEIEPANCKNPTAKNLAFETDLLIQKNNIPLVICEIKYGRFTTHDVLIYSNKALKHKGVYPYLRYGFVVGGCQNITNKFFTHNEGFDFALAMHKLDDDTLKKLLKIIQSQISNAELLMNMLEEKNQTVSFNTRLEFSRL